jgi:two-component system sensor histidine kinase GlrK
MRSYYPKSFLKLLFVGFSLVAIPPIFALFSSAVSFDRLAKQSQKALYQAVQTTHASRQLIEQVANLERTARQYLVLGDATLLQSYIAAHDKFGWAVEWLAVQPPEPEKQALLDQLIADEEAMFRQVTSATQFPQKSTTIPAEFAHLLDLARGIANQGDALVDREVGAMRELANKAERTIIWQLLALIPVALFLVVGFSLLLGKPIRQMDEAIRRLGDGRFDETIVVDGPQDLEHLGNRLNWMRLRLTELEEEKTRFLRHISHELKTPLAALREGTELLHEEVSGALNSQQREIVTILRNNGIQLQRLIEGLLAYHAAQFQRAEVRFLPVHIKALLAGVADAHRLALTSKRINLQLSCPNITFFADEEKIRIILDNLLSNAVNFTPQDGMISVNIARQGQNIVLEILDTGPGIPQQDRRRVFEAFYQGHSEHAGPVKGTGLGLAIVKEYVLAHNGAIEIVDNQQGGAHFKVTLPARLAEDMA